MKETTLKNDIQVVLKAHNSEQKATKATEKFPTSFLTDFNNFETILVDGSNVEQYSKILSLIPKTKSEEYFFITLKKALTLGIKEFKVPTKYYFISEDGELQFNSISPFCVSMSYNQMVDIGKMNKLRLGTKYEYCLYQATVINILLQKGLSTQDAFCYYSKIINPNVCKVLAKEETESSPAFWLAFNPKHELKQHYTFSDLIPFTLYDLPLENSIGWYIL